MTNGSLEPVNEALVLYDKTTLVNFPNQNIIKVRACAVFCKVTSFLRSLAECWDTSFFAFLFVGGSSTGNDSSNVREGALACLGVLLVATLGTFFFECTVY